VEQKKKVKTAKQAKRAEARVDTLLYIESKCRRHGAMTIRKSQEKEALEHKRASLCNKERICESVARSGLEDKPRSGARGAQSGLKDKPRSGARGARSGLEDKPRSKGGREESGLELKPRRGRFQCNLGARGGLSRGSHQPTHHPYIKHVKTEVSQTCNISA